MNDLLNWLAGDGRYMNLVHCMNHDTVWIAITVALDLTVAAGYVLIAMHWWKNQRTLPPVPARKALGNMRNIFLFCGLCGYLFIPIKMIWPAWRLYDGFMVFLVYFTWRYAWGARDLKVVYNELGRSTRLSADLAQSQKESADKSMFINAISHDLRTPLHGLMLQATALEMSVAAGDTAGDTGALRESISQIKTSAQGASRLLNGLLDYVESGTTRNTVATVFELSGLAHSMAGQFKDRCAAKSVAMVVNVPDGMRLKSDRFKLERIVTNLLDNAIKFTDHGTIRIEAESDGMSVELHVLDTGIGIAAEHHDKLFEEFYQVGNGERDRAKGFGLGLAIARKLGGDLTVTSAPGSGSRFTLALPGAIAGDGWNGDGMAEGARKKTPRVAGASNAADRN